MLDHVLDYTKLTHRYCIRSAPHEYDNNYNYYTFTIFILLGYRVLQLFLHQLHATAIAGQSWKVANTIIDPFSLLRHHYALYLARAGTYFTARAYLIRLPGQLRSMHLSVGGRPSLAGEKRIVCWTGRSFIART